MKETVFTKIANKELPAYILAESDKYMAFLDIQPSVKGQTLVIPKEWKDSYLLNNEPEFIAEFFEFVQEVGKKLDDILGAERCVIMFEGYGVDHLHAKLYPMFSKEQAFAFTPREKIEFDEEFAKELVEKFHAE